MKALALCAALAASFLSAGAPAQTPGAEPVRYSVEFPNAAHHEAEITVRFTAVPSGALQVRMSRSSPGRYGLHEFARNVYDFRATDGKGRALSVTRPDPHQWDVGGNGGVAGGTHDGTIEIKYTLFGDHANGTFTGIDNTHARLNMPATFIWARGMEGRPIEVTFKPADKSWKAATQLVPTHHPMMFTAPDLQYFMDSPTELSAHATHSWEAAPGKTIRVALHHQGAASSELPLVEMTKRLVAEQAAVFGGLPDFDYGEYVFILDYLPYVGGDGMEHRNSTAISSTWPMAGNEVAKLGTIAHEMFHAWNVERIRPDSLEPFDFEKSNMSAELWFAEGVTNYYDQLTRARAGIINLDELTRGIGANLNGVINSPARRRFGAADMSRKAAILDGVTFSDRQNLANTYLSYYPFGEAIGLGLDLTIRTRFPGRTLDDVMKMAWERHGKPGVPYTNRDLEAILAEATGDAPFAREFFTKYVEGPEVVDYAALLEQAGLILRKADSGKAWLGDVGIDFPTDTAEIRSTPGEHEPWYVAGLDRGDKVVSIGGERISKKADIDSLLARSKPGDTEEIVFIQRGKTVKGRIRLIENPALKAVPVEHEATEPSAAQSAFRLAWLGSKVADPLPAMSKYCPKCSRAFPFEDMNCRFDGSTLGVVKPER